MKTIIKNYLNKNNFKTQKIEETKSRTLFKTGIALKNAYCDVFINVKTDPDIVIISTFLPVIIPLEQHNKICELIARLNQLLTIGNFDLDMENGDLSLKTSFICNNISKYDKQIFDLNLYISFHFMDKYMQTIMSVIYANSDPIEAINITENIINPKLN